MSTVGLDEAPSRPLDSSAPSEVPRVGGRYELREPLGEGATARVWQAWDTLLRRMVALKVLDGQGSDPASLRRVLREARATSDVVSDHVVRVQGVSGADAEIAYIDMELCAEFTAKGTRALASPMSQVRPRSLREALRWTVEAARGVHAAHEQNVFHRDLKPENILVRPASRRAQVTDFGLGVELALLGERARHAGATVSIRKQKRCIAGTPMYMAPEAAHGLEPADPDVPEQRRTLQALDLYGLGAVLYELVANRPPYVARPGAEDPVQDVLEQVRQGPPPGLRTWRSWLRRGSFRVSRRLERVIGRAMARDPKDRYDSAQELADDLEAILTLRPTSLERDRWLLRLGLAARRHQAPLATLTSVVLMALVLVAGALIGQGLLEDARQALTDQREARAATDEARRQQREAEAQREAAEAQREAATRSRDLTAADARLRVVAAEERASAAEAEAKRLAAREKAAAAAEAAAARRARDLEKSLAAERTRAADAERAHDRAREALLGEQAARAEAEERAARLLAEVERLGAQVAELVAQQAPEEPAP